MLDTMKIENELDPVPLLEVVVDLVTCLLDLRSVDNVRAVELDHISPVYRSYAKYRAGNRHGSFSEHVSLNA